eukprot:462322-Hanusia_phi.AAC.1
MAAPASGKYRSHVENTNSMWNAYAALTRSSAASSRSSLSSRLAASASVSLRLLLLPRVDPSSSPSSSVASAAPGPCAVADSRTADASAPEELRWRMRRDLRAGLPSDLLCRLPSGEGWPSSPMPSGRPSARPSGTASGVASAGAGWLSLSTSRALKASHCFWVSAAN